MGDRVPSVNETGPYFTHLVLYVKHHIASGPLPAKNAWFFGGSLLANPEGEGGVRGGGGAVGTWLNFC